MAEKIEHKIKKQAFRIVDKDFIPILRQHLDDFMKFIDDIENLCKGYNQKAVNHPEGDNLKLSLDLLALKHNLTDLVEKSKATIQPKAYEEELEPYLNSFKTLLAELPEDEIRLQGADRFTNGDATGPMMLIKQLKRFSWRISQVYRMGINLFRREKLGPYFWKQKIPIRRMTAMHYRDGLGAELLKIYEEMYALFAEQIKTLESLMETADQVLLFVETPAPEPKEETVGTLESVLTKIVSNGEVEVEEREEVVEDMVEEEPLMESFEAEEKQQMLFPKTIDYLATLNNIREQVAMFSETLAIQVSKALEKCHSDFEIKVSKAATIELPRFHYSGGKLHAAKRQLKRDFYLSTTRWGQTLDVLQNTWQYRLDMKSLQYLSNREYFRLERTYLTRINNNIVDELKKLVEFIEQAKNEIEEFDGTAEEMRTLLVTRKIHVNKKLTNELVPKTVDFILNQNLPRLINQSEMALAKRIEQLPDKRVIASVETSDLPFANAHIVETQQGDLVNYEAFPKFSESSKHIKTAVFEELNQIQQFITEINQIVAFTIESAVAVFQQEDGDPEKAREVALEGLERGLGRTHDVRKELEHLVEQISNNLRSKVLTFQEDVGRLNNVGEIAKIKTQITTTRALERTRQVRKEVYDYFRNALPMLGFLIVNQYKNIQKRFRKWVADLGLTQTPEVISTEVADYLAATQSAIAKLPFVYQRLFKLEPVTDESFYMKRNAEILELNKAYQSWESGNYAPVAIIGERGSGVSSLFLDYQKEMQGKHKIIHKEVKEMIYSPVQFLHFLGELFGQPQFSSLEEVIKFVLDKDGKSIILLEDTQHVFLKRVNGFQALKMLIELVSKTNKKIFWVVSCTTHTWSYLNKTMDIEDAFAYTITIREMTDEAIIELILKRHRVSGYNVEFIPSKRIQQLKKYQRLDKAEKREFLKNEYFSHLCEFANSNVSLAIIYWLRSTQKVEGNTIFIGVEALNFNFLNSLSTDKLFTIYEILLHNGLREEDLANIREMSIDKARMRLLILFDDGILVKDEAYYSVNLLLYRPLIRLLSARNIIH